MSTSTKGCKLDLEKALAELLSNPELFLRKLTSNNVTVCNTFLNIFENFPETNLKASSGGSRGGSLPYLFLDQS